MNDQQHDKAEKFVSSKYEGEKETYDIILLRLDPTPTLIKLKAFFLRYKFDVETKTYNPQDPVIAPMFDEVGVDDLMAELYNLVSTETILSNLEENDIRRITRDTGERLQEFIWFNWEKYNIKQSDWNRIYSLCLNKIETQLRRAKDGQENKLVAQTFQHREMVAKSSTQKLQEDGQQPTAFGKIFGGPK